MTAGITALRVVVVGHVQGVGFRFFVQSICRAKHLSGWVRNREDGAVEAVIVGVEADLTAVIERVRSARGHQIQNLTVAPIPIPSLPLAEFEIRP